MKDEGRGHAFLKGCRFAGRENGFFFLYNHGHCSFGENCRYLFNFTLNMQRSCSYPSISSNELLFFLKGMAFPRDFFCLSGVFELAPSRREYSMFESTERIIA